MSEELAVPQEVLDIDDAEEVLRAWIGAGDSFVTLRNVFGDDASAWGMLMADVAMHVTIMMAGQNSATQSDTLKAIEDGYRGRMAEVHQLTHRSLSANN